MFKRVPPDVPTYFRRGWSKSMNLSIERKTALGLGLVGLLLVLVSMMAYHNSRASLENSRWVTHTREVIAELNAAQSAVDAWQNAVHEYLLTGESSYLKP